MSTSTLEHKNDKLQEHMEKHKLSESIYMSGHGLDWKDSADIADQLHDEGYRKQSEYEALSNELERTRSMLDNLRDDIRELKQAKSEIASKIFADLEEYRGKVYYRDCYVLLSSSVEKLKKKYMVGE